MKRMSRDEYLDQTLRALVAFFGVEAVKRGVAAIERSDDEPRRPASDRPPRGGLPKVVAGLAQSDPERFELLRPFFEKVAAGELLAQSEDVRWFAERLRIKEPLPGRSRRDLIPHLADWLIAVPLKELPVVLAEAGSISEAERRKGYSVLTDHLLRAIRPAYWCEPGVACAWLRAKGWTINGRRARRGASNIPAPQPQVLYDLHDLATEEGVGASTIVKEIIQWAGRPDVAGDPAHPPTSAQLQSLAEGVAGR